MMSYKVGTFGLYRTRMINYIIFKNRPQGEDL